MKILSPKLSYKKFNQSGFTLLEMLVALVIMGAMGAGVVAYKKMEFDDQKANIAAGHLNAVSKAANAYIKDNYSAIMGIATANKPVLIRVSDLVSEKYLKPNTSSTNPYQQDACALVLQPTPGQLTGMVVTQGGTSLSDATLSSVVARAGASAGGIYTDKPDAIIGARGGWAVNHTAYNSANHLGQNCSGASGSINLEPGHPAVALWFENNDLTAGFLYREEIPGRPELNRMATTLDMGNNDIKNAKNINASGTISAGGELSGRSLRINGQSVIDSGRNIVNISNIAASGSVTAGGKIQGSYLKTSTTVSDGSSCSETGLISKDNKGQILSCQGGRWKSSGKPRISGTYNSTDETSVTAIGVHDMCVLSRGFGRSGTRTYCQVSGSVGGNWYLTFLKSKYSEGKGMYCTATCYTF